MKIAATLVLITSLATAYATQASHHLWFALLAGYLVAGVIAALALTRAGLTGLLQFRRGDPTLGISLGLALLALSWFLRSTLMPSGSALHGWLRQLGLSVGDVEAGWLPAACLIIITAAEELVFRGQVLHALVERFGARAAMPLGAVVYAVAQAPTVLTLADPVAGPNPVLILAALGTGLGWNYLALRLGRLWPGWFCHAVFSYFGAAWLLPASVLVA